MRLTIGFTALVALLAPAASGVAQSVTETEPNDTRPTADTAVLGGAAEGRVASPRGGADTVDYWLVRAEVGETVFVALDGSCPTCIESGFVIQLLQADGTEPSTVQKSGMGAEPQLSYVVAMTGFYFIRVARWANNAGNPGHEPYTLTFRERKCPDDPHEPNGSFAGATPLALDADVRGRWCPNGDRDVFRLSASAGTVLEFWMDSVRGTGYRPPDLRFSDADSVELGRWEFYVSGTPPPSHHRYLVPAGGTFYLEPWNWRGGPDMSYVLHVRSYASPPPGLSLERAARELLNPGTLLTADERRYLDQLGNKSGSYDLGDFQVFLEIMRP